MKRMKSQEEALITPNKPILPPIQHYSRNSCSSGITTPDIYEPLLFDTGTQSRMHHFIGKKGAESVRTAEPMLLPCISSDPLLRITQLEQNIHFLQEQHHMMLSSLHQEIENLRLRNRDLQFQLIFGNVGVKMLQTSSDSSPEDVSKPKIILTPKDVNNRPLQVEMLEREVAELKTSLAEANSKNTNLLQLVEHQKKQLEAAKKDNTDNDTAARLEDADNLIKRLVKENDEQRKEMNTLRTQLNKGSNGGRYGNRRGGGGGGGNGGGVAGSGGGNNDHQRFPPLQTQHYWGHGSQKHKSNSEYHGNRPNLDHEVVGHPPPTLPHLNRTYSQPSSNQRHRYYSNGNHIYRGNSSEDGEGRRRYRGRGGTAAHHKDDHH